MTTADDTLLHRRAPNLDWLSRMAAMAGGAALVLALLAALIGSPGGWRHFFHGYLVGYMLWFGLTLGCLALGMLVTVTGGRWGEVIRPVVVAGAKAVPLMFVLFIPLLFNLPANYPWARPGAEHDEILRHQQAWLVPWFFTLRYVAYFVVWAGLAFALIAWNRRRERDHLTLGAPGTAAAITRITGPGLAIYGVTVTFAAIDWAMSVEPRWFSTIFGLAFIVGQALTALAFATFVLYLLTERIGRVHKTQSEFGKVSEAMFGAGEPAQGPLVRPADFADLGNLMLAFTMLWAYMSFCQFLIQWAGNLPGEVQYFVPRVRTWWRWVGLMLIVCHWAIPFFTLFSRDVKRSGSTLGKVAGWILVMRLVDWIWIIEPSARYHMRDTVSLDALDFGSWFLMDLLVPIGIGGLWVAFFAWQLSGKVVLPAAVADPHGAHGGHGGHDAAHVAAHGSHGHPTHGAHAPHGSAEGGHHA